jgi:hypothetical protein
VTGFISAWENQKLYQGISIMSFNWEITFHTVESFNMFEIIEGIYNNLLHSVRKAWAD